jgi:hypothetical protein
MRGGHPFSLATAELDTLLTALYVLIDDHVIPSGQRRPGRLIDAPGAMRRLAGDRETPGACRMGGLWVLRGTYALVLGAEAVPGHRPGRDARRLVPG